MARKSQRNRKKKKKVAKVQRSLPAAYGPMDLGRFRKRKHSSNTFEHSEMIGPLLSGATGETKFNNYLIDSASLAPWFARIAANYEAWKLHRVSYFIQPVSGTNRSGITATCVTLPGDALASDLAEIMVRPDSEIGTFYEPMYVATPTIDVRGSSKIVVRPGTGDGLSTTDTSFGTLQVMTQSEQSATSNSVVGMLFVKYHVTLENPTFSGPPRALGQEFVTIGQSIDIPVFPDANFMQTTHSSNVHSVHEGSPDVVYQRNANGGLTGKIIAQTDIDCVVRTGLAVVLQRAVTAGMGTLADYPAAALQGAACRLTGSAGTTTDILTEDYVAKPRSTHPDTALEVDLSGSYHIKGPAGSEWQLASYLPDAVFADPDFVWDLLGYTGAAFQAALWAYKNVPLKFPGNIPLLVETDYLDVPAFDPRLYKASSRREPPPPEDAVLVCRSDAAPPLTRGHSVRELRSRFQ